MKKTKLIIICLLAFMCIKAPIQTFAEVQDTEVSIFFENLLNNAFKNEDTLQMQNNLNKDVTAKYIDFIRTEYSLGNYLSIRNLLEENKLSLSYTTIEDSVDQGIKPSEMIEVTNGEFLPIPRERVNRQKYPTMQFKTDGILEVTKVVTKYDYHIATGNKLNIAKEFAVKLQGTFVYDDIGGKIIRASYPRMSLYYAPWGSMFTPFISNVSTSFPIINSTATAVTFKGSYEMMGTFTAFIKGFPIGTTESYGSYQINFTATPSSPSNM